MDSETWQPISELLRRYRSVEYLLISGYVDLDASPKVAKPFHKWVFLGGGSEYLMISTGDSSGMLIFNDARAPSLPNELNDEPSIEPVLLDLSDYHLWDVGATIFESVTLLTVEGADSSEFRAAAFRQANGRMLVFDPFWPYGIKIGNNFDFRWLLEDPSMRYRSITIDMA